MSDRAIKTTVLQGPIRGIAREFDYFDASTRRLMKAHPELIRVKAWIKKRFGFRGWFSHPEFTFSVTMADGFVFERVITGKRYDRAFAKIEVVISDQAAITRGILKTRDVILREIQAAAAKTPKPPKPTAGECIAEAIRTYLQRACNFSLEGTKENQDAIDVLAESIDATTAKLRIP